MAGIWVSLAAKSALLADEHNHGILGTKTEQGSLRQLLQRTCFSDSYRGNSRNPRCSGAVEQFILCRCSLVGYRDTGRDSAGRRVTVVRLQGKVAVITGAGGAFGREIGLTFAREGARLVLGDVNGAAAQKTASEVQAAGGSAVALEVDVRDEKQVSEMVRRALATYGQIDILVNNAGVARSARIQDISLEDWNYVIGVNLTGTFLCCRAVIDHMIARQYGKIINVASISAQTGRLVGVDYSASKSGVVGITRTLALQVAPYGINVNAVAPGPVATPLFERGFPPETVQKLRASVPFKREGTPKDIANLILFLASDESEWITGEVIAINGGAFMG
ncbi:MAG: SDR family NAD(P)-dependent oxidoreductase [Bacillota bacterium]